MIESLSPLGGSGRVVSGDDSGQVIIWDSDTNVVMQRLFDDKALVVCEGDSRVWVASGSTLHRCEVRDESLDVVEKLENEGKGEIFLALTITSGNTLWSCTKSKMKLFDTTNDNLIKVIHLHTLSAICCLSVASVHGKETVFAGGTNEVSVWDTRNRALITTLLDYKGDNIFNEEIGENTMLSAFKTKDNKITLYVFDNNEEF